MSKFVQVRRDLRGAYNLLLKGSQWSCSRLYPDQYLQSATPSSRCSAYNSNPWSHKFPCTCIPICI